MYSCVYAFSIIIISLVSNFLFILLIKMIIVDVEFEFIAKSKHCPPVGARKCIPESCHDLEQDCEIDAILWYHSSFSKYSHFHLHI